jgi:hypothetical protein
MRRPLLDDARAEKILMALGSGAPMEMCAAFAGVGKSAVYNWIKRGANAELEAEKNDTPIAPADEPYVKFARDIEQTQAKRMISAMSRITLAGEKDWKAEAWFLERRYPAMFGRRQQVTVNQDDEADEAAKARELALALGRTNPVDDLYGESDSEPEWPDRPVDLDSRSPNAR